MWFLGIVSQWRISLKARGGSQLDRQSFDKLRVNGYVFGLSRFSFGLSLSKPSFNTVLGLTGSQQGLLAN